jgi:hypothetical protein
MAIKRHEKVNEWYRQRLNDAVKTLANDSGDAFARKIGWEAGGGMVRMVRNGTRQMQDSILLRCKGHDDPVIAHWFDLPAELAALGPLSDVEELAVLSPDIMRALAAAPAKTKKVAEAQLRALLQLDDADSDAEDPSGKRERA